VASPELTDPRSARVRRLRRLARRAYRAETGRFLAEGAQAVREAVAGAAAGDVTVHEVLVTAVAADRHPDLVDGARAASLTVTGMTDEVAGLLSETVTPQGLVAVCDTVDLPLDSLLVAKPRLVVVLADVRDPGNAGAVIRVADAAGADAVVLAGDSVDPYNGKVVRASAGSIFHLALVHSPQTGAVIDGLRAAGLSITVADGSGTHDLDTAERSGDLTAPTAWVFGNEAWGVPSEVLARGDAVLRIPIHGRAESLNLATAAALCLYASRRALDDASSD
jgi:RNA methyltransferase, TrmH family